MLRIVKDRKVRIVHNRTIQQGDKKKTDTKPSSSPVMSSIFSHLNSTGHSANFDDFEILSSCSDTCELMIHESLLISKLKQSNPLLTCRAAQFRLTFYNCFLCLSFFCPLVVSSCYVLFLPSYPLLSLTLCDITPCK